MATYYRTGVETYSIIGTADEKGSLEGRIPDGSTYFAVDENMFYTFYDGTWYETLPEAARLYHDDVGTDTRPIKLVGGVATVVANELAEDSKVVHLAGTETITGIKSFDAARTTFFNDIEHASTLDYMNTGFRNQSKVFDKKNGQYSMMAHQFYYKNGNDASNEYLSKAMRIYKVDRSGYEGYEWRTYNNGILPLITNPVYPVDGQGNHQAISANALEASGQIAVDPRLVHVYGNETIEGNKTYSGTSVFSGPFSTGWYVTYGTTTTADNGKWIRGLHIDLSALRRNNNNFWEALLFMTTSDPQNLFDTDTGVIRVALRGQASNDKIVGSAKWLAGVGMDADFIFTWENGDGWMYYKKRHQYKTPMVIRLFERRNVSVGVSWMRTLTEEEQATAIFTDPPVTDENANIYAFGVEART